MKRTFPIYLLSLNSSRNLSNLRRLLHRHRYHYTSEIPQRRAASSPQQLQLPRRARPFTFPYPRRASSLGRYCQKKAFPDTRLNEPLCHPRRGPGVLRSSHHLVRLEVVAPRRFTTLLPRMSVKTVIATPPALLGATLTPPGLMSRHILRLALRWPQRLQPGNPSSRCLA